MVYKLRRSSRALPDARYSEKRRENITSNELRGIFHRSDDRTAKDYNLEGGATLHLVLALRGGGL